MTVKSYKSSESQQDFQYTTWQDVENISADVEEQADFMFWINAEYAGELVGEVVGLRITLDGSEVATDHFEPVIANQYRNFSPMGLKNLTIGSHSLVLQARCMNPSQTVKVRRIRLLVIKH